MDRRQRGMPGAAVLGHVGEQFSRGEVGDGLDRGRWPVRDVGDQLDRDGAARGEGGQRRAQAAVEHRRVNAPGQVAQLGQGLLGVLVGRADQHPGPVTVISSRSAWSVTLIVARLAALCLATLASNSAAQK